MEKKLKSTEIVKRVQNFRGQRARQQVKNYREQSQRTESQAREMTCNR